MEVKEILKKGAIVQVFASEREVRKSYISSGN